LNVSLFRPIARSHVHSMEVYADALVQSLGVYLKKDERLRQFQPESRYCAGSLLNHYARYIKYPLIARSNQGDINHISDHSYANLVFSLNAQRTIVTFHDAVLLKLMDGSLPVHFKPRFLRILAQKYSISGIKRAAKVIAISHSSREDFLKYADGFNPDDVVVVYLGVDPSFKPVKSSELNGLCSKYGLDTQGQYVLHIGHNEFYKNVEMVFQVMGYLEKDIHLLKVGSDFSPKQWRLINRLGLKDRVRVLPDVSRHDLPSIYNLASVLLFPSLHEGFGFPVLEAMACGTPVVCSDAASLKEIAAKTCLMYPSDDVEGFVEGIRKVLSDSALRKRMKEDGRERALKFDWDVTARKTYEIYREVYVENL